LTSKTRAAFISITVASFLAVIKLITGLLINSLVVISSAIDSIMDIVTSTINYYALKASESPPDKEHPFGHHKFESMASFIQSIIIMLSGAYIFYEAYKKFTGSGIIKNINSGLYIMVISIIITIVLTFYLNRVAKKENSTVLKADALHYEIDILTNSGIIITLIIIKLTGNEMIDPLISVAIAVYIFYSAAKLNIKVVKELVDSKIPESVKTHLIDILNKYEEYHLDFHRLRTRQAGSKKFIDLHLTLCKKITLEDAHAIADAIERQVKKEIKDSDITIHIEPCTDKDCPGIENCKKKPKIENKL